MKKIGKVTKKEDGTYEYVNGKLKGVSGDNGFKSAHIYYDGKIINYVIGLNMDKNNSDEENFIGLIESTYSAIHK